MCYHFDPEISTSLAFVLFPQTFRNISEDDIYDGQIRCIFKIHFHGLDGLRGPILSGTNFYMKREALIGNFSAQKGCRSISYLQVGFMYFCVLEDYFTGFILHCNGWKSVYLNPPRPQFLGTSTTNFSDLSIQRTRWASGLVEVAISRFCPLVYGPLRMSLLQSMCYAELAFSPLLSCLSLWVFALIPQLCLFNGIPLYPGLGMRKASFLPTNKVGDNEQVKLYEMGVFDFRTATMFLAPLVTIILVNIASFVGGVARIMFMEDSGDQWKKMVGQIFLSFYILITNYTVIEGMIMRMDKARIPASVTLLSAVSSVIILLFGSSIRC
ncbi:hypothetical protein DITRI_Ditri08aG0035900 [Diplodiscus trichospermus]